MQINKHEISHQQNEGQKPYDFSIDAEKSFNKIHQFIINNLGTEGNAIKAIHDKPTESILLNEENLEAFPLRCKTRQGWKQSLTRLYSSEESF